ALIGVALVALIAVLVFVPGTLKVEAKGQLLPKTRATVYADIEGRVLGFKAGVAPGKYVAKDRDLIQMYDDTLANKITALQADIAAADRRYQTAKADLLKAKSRPNVNQADVSTLIKDMIDAETQKTAKTAELRAYQKRSNADLQQPGVFWLKAPLG